MASVIAVVNQKGGVGKTTSTVNLSAALARSGFKTLLIDLDPQAHSVEHLGVKSIQGETVLEVLSGNIQAISCLIPTYLPNLWVLPANLRLGIFSGFSAEEMSSFRFDLMRVERRSKIPMVQRASRKAASSRRCDVSERVMLSYEARNSSKSRWASSSASVSTTLS